MNFLLTLHSINRWLIVVIGVVAAVKFLIGWLRKADYQSSDQGLLRGYTGLLDLQLLLGLILFVVLLIDQGLVRYRLEHAIPMVIAVVLAHLVLIWRTKPDPVKFRNAFLVIAAGLLLIIAGVAVLPLGWTLTIGRI